MKKALIKKPCKTNMQSGLKKTKSWIVEFQFDSSLKKDVLDPQGKVVQNTLKNMGMNKLKNNPPNINTLLLLLTLLVILNP